jgi:hypothetical protein
MVHAMKRAGSEVHAADVNSRAVALPADVERVCMDGLLLTARENGAPHYAAEETGVV